MFDNICKFLPESFSSDFATWLLGEQLLRRDLMKESVIYQSIQAEGRAEGIQEGEVLEARSEEFYPSHLTSNASVLS
nr:hypothetical protein [Scytonema sp. UIC 10036]